MGIVLVLAAYLAYGAFWYRLVSHLLIWFRFSTQPEAKPVTHAKPRAETYAEMFFDTVFFRRLFIENKPLWIGSWTFHVSFFLVLLRHIKYFLNPVPDIIRYLQPLGLLAGYLLPLSLLYILLLRSFSRKRRYVSSYNYFILSLLLLISSTGVLMRTVFRTDLVTVKEFILGMMMFTPGGMPDSMLFVLHFILVLLLLPFLPLHIIAAPFVTINARLREEERKMVLHEKEQII